MKNKIILLIIYIFIIPTIVYGDDELQYENGENACTKCNCTQKEIQKHVYTLNCSERNLTQILSSYGNLMGTENTTTSGKIIDITFSGNNINHLKQLPATDATMSFSCKNCRLSEIASAAFIDTPRILALDLSDNQLSGDSITSDIFRGRYNDQSYEPIGLLHINLSNNSIDHLDRLAFEHVPNLRQITLAKNPLKLLDEGTILAIASLKNLVHLDLSYTELETIPDELFNETMPKLRDLKIEGNLLKTIPESLGCLVNSLRTLHIGGNPIKSLTDDSFLGMKKLHQLHIDNMYELEAIQSGAFASLISLEILSCTNNGKLTEFDLGYLVWSAYLREIYLSNSSITSLLITLPKALNESDSLPLNRLKWLKLNNNPWHCDCSLYKSLERIKKHSTELYQHNGGARCESPYELVSDLLTDLTSDTSCKITNIRKPYRPPLYELPPFLRPRSILISLLSILTVILIGLCIGLVIVRMKKKLLDSEIGFAQPIRYTTVRNSTTSIE